MFLHLRVQQQKGLIEPNDAVSPQSSPGLPRNAKLIT